MKLQFSLRSLLFATGFAGICLAGAMAIPSVFQAIVEPKYDQESADLAGVFFMLTPAWMPLLFVGYALGRRSLTARTLIALAVGEIVAVGVSACVFWYVFRMAGAP